MKIYYSLSHEEYLVIYENCVETSPSICFLKDAMYYEEDIKYSFLNVEDI
jgi:hypothetical protein